VIKKTLFFRLKALVKSEKILNKIKMLFSQSQHSSHSSKNSQVGLEKRKFTLQFKRRVIRKNDELGSLRQTAKEYRIDRASIRQWVKNKVKYFFNFENID